jgi:hypothetical protein
MRHTLRDYRKNPEFFYKRTQKTFLNTENFLCFRACGV